MRGTIADNLMAEFQHEEVTALSNSARTASGASQGVECPVAKTNKLAVLVAVTAVSGTSPTLNIAVEWSNNNSTFYKADPDDTFTQVVADTDDMFKLFDIKARYFRVAYIIAGTTPSFSFSVSATGR